MYTLPVKGSLSGGEQSGGGLTGMVQGVVGQFTGGETFKCTTPPRRVAGHTHTAVNHTRVIIFGGTF